MIRGLKGGNLNSHMYLEFRGITNIPEKPKMIIDSLFVPFTLLNFICNIFEYQSILDVIENTNVVGRVSFQTFYVLVGERSLISMEYYQLQVELSFQPLLYFWHYVYHRLYYCLSLKSTPCVRFSLSPIVHKRKKSDRLNN